MTVVTDEIIREREPMGLESSFVQIYKGLFEASTGFKCITTLPLYLFMGEHLSDDNVFWFNPERREEFLRLSGASNSSFYRALNELKDGNLIWEEASNVYRLNPVFIWRGENYRRDQLVIDIRKSMNAENKEPYRAPKEVIE